jgi:hypothetical protein
MIVGRIQLYCDGNQCTRYFPPEGPVDSAMMSAADLRGIARGFGWSRRRAADSSSIDLCPDCGGKKPTRDADLSSIESACIGGRLQ